MVMKVRFHCGPTGIAAGSKSQMVWQDYFHAESSLISHGRCGVRIAQKSVWKMGCNADIGSSLWCNKGFFSQCTLLQSQHSPQVLSHDACINNCACVKSPKHCQWQALFGHTKMLQTMITIGSTALAAAVPYPGMGTGISCKSWQSPF